MLLPRTPLPTPLVIGKRAPTPGVTGPTPTGGTTRPVSTITKEITLRMDHGTRDSAHISPTTTAHLTGLETTLDIKLHGNNKTGMMLLTTPPILLILLSLSDLKRHMFNPINKMQLSLHSNIISNK